jgi:hypothetical protein
MFDNEYHIHQHDTRYVTKEIHEHRAPTDESVKLLNEMQEKVLSNVLKKFSVNNTLNVKGMVYNNYLTMEKELHCSFSINGVEHSIKVVVDEFKCRTVSEAAIAMHEQICQRLALEIVKPLSDGLLKSVG